MVGLSALPRKSASLFVPVNPVTNNGFAGATIPDAKQGAVPKVQLAVVVLVETTIFSAMVITYWTAPFFNLLLL